MTDRSRTAPPPPGDPRHGRRYLYTNYHCRCPLCTEANRVGCAEAKARRAQRTLAPDDPRHGDASTYSNWGCRCKPCTDAQTERCKPYQRKWYRLNRVEINEKQRERRAMRRELAPDDPRHGTSTGYHYWACRCPACVGFSSAENKANYQKRKAAQDG